MRISRDEPLECTQCYAMRAWKLWIWYSIILFFEIFVSIIYNINYIQFWIKFIHIVLGMELNESIVICYNIFFVTLHSILYIEVSRMLLC